MVAIPGNHPTLKEAFKVAGYCSSLGGTPVASYIPVPFNARVGKIGVIPYGAITTADCTITVAVNGTTNTNLAGTLPLSGAAAGVAATWSPATPVYVAEGDYITLTPSGASGANIAGMFHINFVVGS
jgi:hypothetical protein